MNKGKAKKNTKGNKRFTKRRHCGRKKNTRNLPKKRGNVTRRRGRKILGGEPPNYIKEYLLSKNDDDPSINKNDGRTYVDVNDFGDDDIDNNKILDKLLKNNYFFVDYLDEDDDDHAKKLELGYYKGLLMKQVTGKVQQPVTIKKPVYSQLLRFVTTKGIQQNIPRQSQYIGNNEKFYIVEREELIKDFNSNIIDKLYYYPLTSRLKSRIDSFRSTLPNYPKIPKIPTFSFGLSSNKDNVDFGLSINKYNDDIFKPNPLRERTSTDSTDSTADLSTADLSTADSSTASDTKEKYILIKSIDDMKKKIEKRMLFAKLDDTGNYIDYHHCRINNRNDQILCDYINERGELETDTITVKDIDENKIFYLEK